MPKITLEGWKCLRCNHVWVPRSKIEELPTICPRCKSPYWNKARQDEMKKKFDKIDRARLK